MFESLSTEQRLVRELTQLDERKRARDPYFLGIAFQSLVGFDADVSAGMLERLPERFTRADEL